MKRRRPEAGTFPGGSFPRDSVVWITGASSGIGASLAELCAAEGAEVLVLSGRSRERLQTVAERCRAAGRTALRVEILPFDAGNPPERAGALAELAARELIPDVLVNNAGVSQRGLAVNTVFSVDRDIMEVDFLAPVELTKAVLPAMIRRGRGTVVVVSSVAGLIPAPLRSGYNAAKAAQIAYFGTLSNELAASGSPVGVVTVIPGFVRTGISENAIGTDGTAWGRMDPNQEGGIGPDRAAADIAEGIRRGRRVVFTGVPARLRIALMLRRFAPAILDRVLQRVKVT
ncbi:MAG: SDR family NAD(P)-dependent oxidoreductase [Spirochaetaceae bacterium]|nr:MAG: SDR family NAD(P)-dependent oxidoreductase [Spirochaetaceae bacterium]